MKMARTLFVFWIAALGLIACSRDDREAGGVTDIGNSIAGNVVLADGSPAAHARVVVYYDAWNADGISDSVETMSDASGAFVLDGVEDRARVYFAAKDSSCVLSADESDSLVLTLGASKRLSGKVVRAGSGKMRLVGSSLSAAIAADGSFSFDSLPPGSLSLAYLDSSEPQARFEFSTTDSRSSIALPDLVELDSPDSLLVVSDAGLYADTSFGVQYGSGMATAISVALSDASRETLEGFVLPVKFNDKIDFSAFADADSFKVVSASGAELPFEVDYWTPLASQGVLWVRLDSLAAGDSAVSLYLIRRTVEQSPAGAFLADDSVMAAVHLNGDAQVYSGLDYVVGSGIIGYGATLSAGQYVPLDSINPCDGDFTLSVWALWNGKNGNHQILFARRASWADSTIFEWYYEQNSAEFAVYDVDDWDFFSGSYAAVTQSADWRLLSLVSRSDTVSMYVDGELVGDPIAFKIRDVDFNVPFLVGGDDIVAESWNGSLDEIRVVGRPRSAEWLRMEFVTQSLAKN